MRLQRCQGGYIYNYLEKKFSPVSIFKRERAKDNRREEGGGEVPAFPLKVAPAQPCLVLHKCLQR